MERLPLVVSGEDMHGNDGTVGSRTRRCFHRFLSGAPPSDWVAMTVRDQLRPTSTLYKVYEDAVIKAKLKHTFITF